MDLLNLTRSGQAAGLMIHSIFSNEWTKGDMSFHFFADTDLKPTPIVEAVEGSFFSVRKRPFNDLGLIRSRSVSSFSNKLTYP